MFLSERLTHITVIFLMLYLQPCCAIARSPYSILKRNTGSFDCREKLDESEKFQLLVEKKKEWEHNRINLVKSNSASIYRSTSLNDKETSYLYNASSILSRTDLSTKSLCPWNNEVKKRENKFPEYVLEAICLSKSAIRLDYTNFPSQFNCLPVQETRAVLIRKCNSDGFYKWEPDYERVNVGCICANAINDYIHVRHK
jgi:hypothetical protein